jgi:hypothetical protein
MLLSSAVAATTYFPSEVTHSLRMEETGLRVDFDRRGLVPSPATIISGEGLAEGLGTGESLLLLAAGSESSFSWVFSIAEAVDLSKVKAISEV